MKISNIFLVAIFSFVFLGCKHNEKKDLKSKIDLIQHDNTVKNVKKEEPESFDEFNKKFHSDSLFQVSRVDFPIEGKHVTGFEQYNWTRKNWQFQVIPVAKKTEIGEYQHSLVKSDTLITEKFWIDNSGFEVERKFKLIKNKWFLIYYNDINL